MTFALPLVLALLAAAPDKGVIAARELEKRASQLQREGQYPEVGAALSRKAGLSEIHANIKDANAGLKKIDRIQARR